MDTNVLYYGDNLEILRKYIPDDSIDLIYLDPPFNSQASYNILYKESSGELSHAQVVAFEDTWQWGIESELALQEIASSVITSHATKEFISVLPNFVGNKTPMRAYLTMMCIRLVELKRVLKNTGSIYLHCDSTASHYLKILMDTIFNASNFRNEIVWKRTGAHNSAKRYGPVHDIILYYSKTNEYTWQQQYQAQEEYIQNRYSYVDDKGRNFYPVSLIAAGIRHGSSGQPWHGIDVASTGNHWRYTIEKLDELDANGDIYWPSKGDKPRLKMYADNAKGSLLQDWWDNIPAINSQAKERLGYPTQKPEALLERIINASSKEGDIVLDPFCGCGTALVCAQKLNRKWIGIDITHLAISTMKWRLDKIFPGLKYTVIGEPKDLESARALAKQDKYQFQWWAVSLIKGGQPYGDKKKGADSGIDGYLIFMDEKDKIKKAILSVKGGHITVSQVRDLIGVVKREKAEMGIFITLEPMTKPMEQEAVLEGFYHSPLGKDYQKIQVLTIEELLSGKKPDTPSWVSPIATPDVHKKKEGKAIKML